MQSAYSWMGSRLHLVLEDEVANAYNRAQEAWYAAQTNHKKLHGREWNPVSEPLLIDWTDEQRKAWDDIGSIINLLIEVNGGGLAITEEEITSDFLEKL
jgi:hypothetical protein